MMCKTLSIIIPFLFFLKIPAYMNNQVRGYSKKGRK